MANLPGPATFHALRVGAENIPDAAFEKLPVVGKYFREDKDKKDRRRNDENRSSRGNRDYSSSDSESESSYSRDNRSRGPRRRRERARRDRSRDYENRGYDSDRGPRGYDENTRFPPPPLVPIINEPHNMPPNNTNQTFIPAKYNPQSFGSSPGGKWYITLHSNLALTVFLERGILTSRVIHKNKHPIHHRYQHSNKL
jgi:hypothetical protein